MNPSSDIVMCQTTLLIVDQNTGVDRPPHGGDRLFGAEVGDFRWHRYRAAQAEGLDSKSAARPPVRALLMRENVH